MLKNFSLSQSQWTFCYSFFVDPQPSKEEHATFGRHGLTDICSSALPSPTFETETFTIQPYSSFQLYYPNNLLLYQLLLRPMLSEILAIWDKSYPGQKLPHAKSNFDLMQMLQFYTLFLCFNPFFKGNNLSFELFWGIFWFCVSENPKKGVNT